MRKVARDKCPGAKMFHIAMIKVPVTDIDRAAAFYGRMLDLEPAVLAPEFGWAHFEAEALTLAVYIPGMGNGDRAPGGSVDFSLAAVDLAPIQERMAELVPGAEVRRNDDGSVSLELTDADGNVVTIMGPALPR